MSGDRTEAFPVPRSGDAPLAGALDALGARALVVVGRSGRDPDVAWWVGDVKLAASLVVAPRDGAPRLGYWTPMEREEAARSGLELLTPEALDIARWARSPEPGQRLADTLARALQLSGVAPGTIAITGLATAGTAHAAAARLERDGWTVVDGADVMRRLRRRKQAREIERIRRAARGTVDAFFRVAERLAASTARAGELWLEGERLRVGRLREEVAVALARLGLEQPEGNILAPGEQGAVPHSRGDDGRVLRAGESLVVDLYPRGGLFADCTRTFCVGEPSPGLAAGHAAVVAALEKARAAARPGVAGFDLQSMVCDELGGLGYPTPLSHPGTLRGYVHGLGHGVGYELHELPVFTRDSGADGVLAAGDVLTIEPGLYEPEAGWAVRVEDLHWLDPDGRLQVLTPLPTGLDPRSWAG